MSFTLIPAPLSDIRPILSPILVIGNGPSWKEQEIPDIPTMGCHGIVYEEKFGLPDFYLTIHYDGLIKWIRKTTQSLGTKYVVIPELRDNGVSWTYPKAITFRRGPKANLSIGILENGCAGKLMLQAALKITKGPVILAGFDGTDERPYADRPMYKDLPDFRKLYQDHRRIIEICRENSGRVFKLYSHGKLPCPTWRPKKIEDTLEE